MFSQYKGTRFVVWVKVIVDPFEKARGFSLKGSEFRVEGYEPVSDTMVDMQGNKMPGTFWVVAEDELFRVVPKMKKATVPQHKPWFFPIEFCEPFLRPNYYMGAKVVNHRLR